MSSQQKETFKKCASSEQGSKTEGNKNSLWGKQAGAYDFEDGLQCCHHSSDSDLVGNFK